MCQAFSCSSILQVTKGWEGEQGKAEQGEGEQGEAELGNKTWVMAVTNLSFETVFRSRVFVLTK